MEPGQDPPKTEGDTHRQVPPDGMRRRFLLDSNVYDRLVETPERQRMAIEAHDLGRIELLITHVQVDELMQDAGKRGRTLAIPATITETYGFVLDVSRLGLARFGEPEELDRIDSAGRKHRKDALLAVTARHEGAVLVTDDRRLQNFASRDGIEVWNSDRFVNEGLMEYIP